MKWGQGWGDGQEPVTQVLLSPGKEIRNLFLRKQEIDYLMFYFAFDEIYPYGGNILKQIRLAEVDKL